MLRLERVHSADGRPVIYSTAVIPHRIVEGLDGEGVSGSLFALFGELGYPVAHGEAILVPVLAGLRHSEVLGIDEGKPLLQITQVDYSTVGDVVMFSKEWHVPGFLSSPWSGGRGRRGFGGQRLCSASRATAIDAATLKSRRVSGTVMTYRSRIDLLRWLVNTG